MVPRLRFRLLPSSFPGACQMVTALFRGVPPKFDLTTSCWKAHGWLVRAVHDDDGSHVKVSGHMCCSQRWETTPTSPWRARVEPAPTHDRSGFQPFPSPCPGATRCRPTLLCYACSVPTGPAARDRPAPSFPCTDRHGPQKRKEGSRAPSPMLQEATAGSGCRHSAQGRGQGACRSLGLLSL